jgi:hypothetical protein
LGGRVKVGRPSVAGRRDEKLGAASIGPEGRSDDEVRVAVAVVAVDAAVEKWCNEAAGAAKGMAEWHSKW